MKREVVSLCTCRHCGEELSLQMIDLGASPPSNALNASQDAKERHYPLRVMVCTNCWLAQTDISLFELGYDELFTEEYPYYSSTSKEWVEHAREFVEMATKRFRLGPETMTVEIGANDGYLLQHMKTPCYGVEPTRTGDVAKEKGVTIYPQFFGAGWANSAAYSCISRAQSKSRDDGGLSMKADLLIANNVLAHVPDINDFVKGVAILLKDEGTAVFEFPHLLNLVVDAQFDTIYHEHYSYLSLTSVRRIFAAQGLHVYDVERLPTHGGSLRVYATKAAITPLPSVASVIAEEGRAGMWAPGFYQGLQAAADRIKDEFLGFLLRAKEMKLKVAGFGAAAKGNTLLNYAGVRDDLISYVVDDTPTKQGKFLPGSRIPVVSEFRERPDYIVVFPWNFRAEIMKRLASERAKGARLVFAIPRLEIV